MAGFLTLASRADVVRRALRTALLVGTLLMLINHGDALMAGDVDGMRLLRIVLTFLVPYGVATYASVQALRKL
ncbi:MAG: nitrate/nitrite transporter NrtS [Pseudomonadaceae bacterium]|nr:nitrate/nitrite transporter NrtS [Pseudomonadaceae bacterium]